VQSSSQVITTNKPTPSFLQACQSTEGIGRIKFWNNCWITLRIHDMDYEFVMLCWGIDMPLHKYMLY